MWRDECGDWRIVGKNGHIYATDEYYYLYLSFPYRPKSWTVAKRRLGMEVTQDGDDEGFVRFHDAPADAGEFRRILGVRKRKPGSIAEHLRRHRFQPIDADIGGEGTKA
jgi:hypothetical protein